MANRCERSPSANRCVSVQRAPRFDTVDAEFFFGREQAVAEAVGASLAEGRFLALVGPSGSGESSLLVRASCMRSDLARCRAAIGGLAR